MYEARIPRAGRRQCCWFDDISIAATFDPPLTTIRQERNELGRCAYDILNSLIHHIPISKTLLRPKLIERESTARCAHRD